LRNVVPGNVVDKQVLAGSHHAGAQSSLVEVVEHCAADQFALSVEADTVEQPRGQLYAQGGYEVDDLEAAVLAQVEQLAVELVVGEPFARRDLKDAERGWGGPVMPARPWPLDCGKSLTGWRPIR